MKDLIAHNRAFVENREYELYRTSKYPNKKLAILTCMDTRLTELLPAALGLKNGDAKIIKNAGGTISHPFGSAMRSLLIAIYELGVTDILVIGHTDCGVQCMNAKKMLQSMKERGVSEKALEMARYFNNDLEQWLGGFEHVEAAVANSVQLLRKHPLITPDVHIYGYVMDSETGELYPVWDEE